MFLHQWLILCHFVDVNESKIKFTNVSDVLMKYCIMCGDMEQAYNDCPQSVREHHKYIKEPDDNNEEELLQLVCVVINYLHKYWISVVLSLLFLKVCYFDIHKRQLNLTHYVLQRTMCRQTMCSRLHDLPGETFGHT